MNKLIKKDCYKIIIFKSHGIVAPTLVTHLGEGFMNLGHEVMVYDIEKKILQVPVEDGRENVFKLVESLHSVRPDLALMYGVSAVIPIQAPERDATVFRFPEEARGIIKGDTHLLSLLRVPYLCYFGDNPLQFNTPADTDSPSSRSYRDPFRFMQDVPGQWLSLWDDYYIAEMKEKGYRNLLHTPLGTSSSFFFDIPENELPAKYRCDVSFVGSPTPERVSALMEISRFANLAVFGWDDWKKYSEIMPFYRGPASYPDEANLIYNGSKINIELKKNQMKTTFTQRQFDAAAGGNFVLGDYRPGLEKFLAPDSEFVTFKNNDELVSKARYFLEHEEERKSIAAAAGKRVLSEHTWTHRAKSILDNITV